MNNDMMDEEMREQISKIKFKTRFQKSISKINFKISKMTPEQQQQLVAAQNAARQQAMAQVREKQSARPL